MSMPDYVEVTSTGDAKDNEDVVVDGTVGGVVLLPENKYRKSALIINIGSDDMRVTTDGTAPTTTRGKLVASGSSLILTSPYCPTSAVKAIRRGAVSTIANASEVS